MEPILVEWEHFARSLSAGAEMDIVALRDHAEAILRSTARDMVSPQTALQQSSKSKGHGGGGSESAVLNGASREHAIGRLASGFNIIEVVSEYRALRASVLRLWSESARGADPNDLQDLTRFNESMDQSLAEAVRSYTDRVEESRELFLATLGHDLRNPLNAIGVTAELLARTGQLDAENTQLALQIADFRKMMSRMIDDLLDFTRSRLGRGMPIAPVSMDLQPLCREVIAEYQAVERDRALHFDASGDTTGEWDRERLRQLVSNLIANAIEHGDQTGSVEVSLASEGPEVLLTVANRGTPIPADALPTLFDPFVRGPQSTASNFRRLGSFGLGLYIVREVVLAHGGSIAVTSSAPAGTAFKVRLP
ncbi:MAG TPA: HAMP domain-containing sensor histidine kinase, partial [Thermoanaerobaculia bacterium]|nr:HAMP domain-containing sensor histidine kinase [Thermoanaerobaculia bacterium]